VRAHHHDLVAGPASGDLADHVEGDIASAGIDLDVEVQLDRTLPTRQTLQQIGVRTGKGRREYRRAAFVHDAAGVRKPVAVVNDSTNRSHAGVRRSDS